MTDRKWLQSIDSRIIDYLSSLETNEGPGRYIPCKIGTTKQGRKAGLGFSCFALKLMYSLKVWDGLNVEDKKSWIGYINSYQQDVVTRVSSKSIGKAYVDQTLVEYLDRPRILNLRNILGSTSSWDFLRSIGRPNSYGPIERLLVAETKQALATLDQVGEQSVKPFDGFPMSSAGVKNYMASFDWRSPWSSGGQTASLAVFLSTEAPRLMASADISSLKTSARAFYRSIADPVTGGYFTGRTPPHGLLVNGAMKVLTALDWLEEPIHYPEQLIATTLSEYPRVDGCNLVDSIYVLYRCANQTTNLSSRAIEYINEIMNMIAAHHNTDGGFSYNVGRAQKWYYGVPISKGLKESDIHGTVLLVWALAMIFELLGDESIRWRVLRP
jgi:hypothetical protein